jgi:hypothetical protein
MKTNWKECVRMVRAYTQRHPFTPNPEKSLVATASQKQAFISLLLTD